MRAYSMDLRERALLDSDAGMKAADVAAKYRVSGSWVRLLKQRRRDTGEVAPRVQRQGRRGMLEPHLHTLAALIAAHPDRTLAELKDALRAIPDGIPTRLVSPVVVTAARHDVPLVQDDERAPDEAAGVEPKRSDRQRQACHPDVGDYTREQRLRGPPVALIVVR